MITHRTRSGWTAPHRPLMTVLSTVILLALSIRPNSVAAQTGVVGRVIDPAGKTAITDARVSAHDDRGREHAVAFSDSVGFFKLRLLPGSYYLQSVRVGYEPTKTGTVDFSDDEQVEVIIQMSARPL